MEIRDAFFIFKSYFLDYLVDCFQTSIDTCKNEIWESIKFKAFSWSFGSSYLTISNLLEQCQLEELFTTPVMSFWVDS